MPQQIGLTSFSIAVASRVVKHVAQLAKGASPEADRAFEIVYKVLDNMLQNFS